MRSRVVTLSVLLVVSFSIPGFSAESDVLKMAPADSLFCARINNLDATTGSLDQFISGVLPMPVVTSMLVKAQLSAILGNPNLDGLNTAGSFAVFGKAELNQMTPDIYVLIPVTNYDKLADVNTNVSRPDANGVSVITMAGRPFVYMSKIGSFAVISKDYAKTMQMAKSLSAGSAPSLAASLDAAQAKQADTEPVWIYGNIQQASKIYGPMLFAQIEQLKTMMPKPAEPNKPAPPMNPAVMIDMYSGMLKTLMNEGKSLTIAVNPKADLLLIKTTFNAVHGTETAGMLSADKAPAMKNNLVGFTEDGSMMNLAGRMNHTTYKKFNTKFIDLIAQFAGKDANAADVVKTKKLCDDMVDSMGEKFICTLSADPNAKTFIDAKYVIEVKDADKFNKGIDEFAQTWSGGVFDDLYKKMGIEMDFTVKRGVDKYQGISIDAATLSMKFADANSPESQMINAMYGKGFGYRWAVVNGLWVCRISDDPNAIYKLIDQVKAGPPAQVCPEMQKALSIIPDADNADVVATYNYLRLFKMMSAMMPMPMPKMDIPSKSNLVFAARVRDGSLSLDMALPKEHLSEMMMAFQMMQMQMMQQKMQNQQMQTPPSAPAEK